MYEHLLVPTDGTPLSVETVSRAVRFARKLGARVTFFYFADDEAGSVFGDSALLHAMAPGLYAEKYAWRQKAVLWKAEAEALALAVPCASVMASRGTVADAILHAAEEGGCDLIFMASHGRTSQLRMMLGSVTLKVLVNSSVPVLVSDSGKQPFSTMNRAMNIIREEHRSLSAVLRGLGYMLEKAANTGQKPDFAVIRAILSYLREFSGQLHHPKEEDYLFRKLRQKTSEFNSQMDELGRQHVQEPKLIEELEAVVAVAEQAAKPDMETLRQSVERLVSHVNKHMGLEETLLMPAAGRLLGEEDWQEIEKAFLDNGDPRFGAETEDEFRFVFARIVNLFPSARELSAPGGQ